MRKDNSSPELKTRLRCEATRAIYGNRRIAVLDCCAGQGLIWSKIAEQRPVGPIVRLDIKPSIRRNVRANSIRWLRTVPVDADLVDIDTYGCPLAHYHALLHGRWRRQSLLVFLTLGAALGGMTATSTECAALNGIPAEWATKLPKTQGLKMALQDRAIGQAWAHGIAISRYWSCRTRHGGCEMQYLGLWLVKTDHVNAYDCKKPQKSTK